MKRKCKDGDEVAAFTSERYWVRWRAGERKAVKRRANRRERQLWRQTLDMARYATEDVTDHNDL